MVCMIDVNKSKLITHAQFQFSNAILSAGKSNIGLESIHDYNFVDCLSLIPKV